MKTKLNNTLQKHLYGKGQGLLVAALLTAAGWCSSCQDDYDLDEKLPPNFGSNLMTHLEDNGFTTYAQLAKDLDYVNALSGVSLKTLLAADDEAFNRFFQHNQWGVKSYDELTLAQKKLLFYNSMLDNSLQLLNLSSTSGQQEALVGNAMRRTASGSIYDSVPVILASEMPDNNPDWDYYRNVKKSIVCMKDMTAKPIIFFIEPYLRAKGITNADVNFLYNGEINRQTKDANIGRSIVVEDNIRCPNGFIHQMKDVLVPLDNMSEIIRKNKNTQIFSRILERFSAPFYAGDDETRNYNHEYGTKIDSLYVKRYYATRSVDNLPNINRPNNGPEVGSDEVLRFDPGWNCLSSDQKGVDATVAMQSNMPVMLVPSDKAMEEYWNGAGSVIRDYYHHYDSVPNYIWAELVNNGMLNSLVSSVPSRFDGIVNSNQDPMGLKNNDTTPIDSVFLGCNGAVYLTNRVFAPTSFRSVSFPTLVNETMSIFRWAIKKLEYRSYLNSLDSYYSFFIPTNEALMVYYDPCAYLGTNNQMWKFHYKPDAATDDERVWAAVYSYDLANGVIGDSIGKITDPGTIADRLEDLLDTHIVVGNKDLNSNVENGHDFYRTKNGGIIAVKHEGGEMYVQGTFQRDHDKWLKVTSIYDQTLSDGNGKTYILDGEPGEAEPIMTTRKSTFDILAEHEEFSMFLNLLSGSSLLELKRNNKFDAASDAGNIAAFNNFNYTVYVPTNESLEAIFADKSKYNLYTWEEIGEYELRIDSDPTVDQKKVDMMKSDLEAFLRYHIQDNLLMIGLDYANDGVADYDEQGNLTVGDTFTRNYETACMNEETQKFFTVSVHCEPGSIEVTDMCGNTRKVVKQKDLYNLTAREYLLDWSSISASSHASIHLIDGPLFYNK